SGSTAPIFSTYTDHGDPKPEIPNTLATSEPPSPSRRRFNQPARSATGSTSTILTDASFGTPTGTRTRRTPARGRHRCREAGVASSRRSCPRLRLHDVPQDPLHNGDGDGVP